MSRMIFPGDVVTSDKVRWLKPCDIIKDNYHKYMVVGCVKSSKVIPDGIIYLDLLGADGEIFNHYVKETEWNHITTDAPGGPYVYVTNIAKEVSHCMMWYDLKAYIRSDEEMAGIGSEED